jgi:hypothetical protein
LKNALAYYKAGAAVVNSWRQFYELVSAKKFPAKYFNPKKETKFRNKNLSHKQENVFLTDITFLFNFRNGFLKFTGNV